VIETVRSELASAGRWLFCGGKSMGGRIATQVAAADGDLPVAGLVLVGYPLHPPGRPQMLRAAHLPAVRRPMLFVQGSRDSFGTPGELEPILATLTPPPAVHVVTGGDHSLKLSGRHDQSQAAVYAGAQQAIADWMNDVISRVADATTHP
jgi:predicted alpha/beta-hydrolase family hydrolase